MKPDHEIAEIVSYLIPRMPLWVTSARGEAVDTVAFSSGAALAALDGVLHQFPRQEVAVLMLADVTLTRAIGWDRPLPLLAAHLSRKDLRAISDGGTDPERCVHRARAAQGQGGPILM